MSRRVAYETRILWLALVAGAPAMALAMGLLWLGDFAPKVQWTLGLLVGLWWLGFSWAVRERVIRPLQTLSNLVAALAEGDFSIRARRAKPDEALGLAFFEVNQLTDTLRAQRLGAVEAMALLRTVMAEIDIAVFAFDGEERLRLVNRVGESLLARPAEKLLGRPARALGLADFLRGDTPRLVDLALPGSGGRWELRRGAFRQEGLPHQLVLLSDLSRTLREEERQAWKRLVRVLSHEINNSLAPVRSMAGSLLHLLGRQPRPADWETDLERGLDVVAGRAEALIRFMQSYARLARLPPPERESLDVAAWVQRVVRLETRLPVAVAGGPPVTVRADGDQLDQLLINLVGNGVEAALETGGSVRVGWQTGNGHLDVWVEDDGPGLSDTTNLFVPFFTTKPKGTGIGLALSREIAEAHEGSLSLKNRRDGRGCVARLRLPLR